MRLYHFLITFLLTPAVHAQLWDKTAFNAAYRYTGRNVVQAGLEFKTNTGREQSMIAGASVLYTSVNQKDKFLPEANIYYTHSQGLLMGVSVNPYSIEPRIGFSFINILYINTGYAIPIHREKFFKGITFGVQFNISPAKKSKFYNHLRLM